MQPKTQEQVLFCCFQTLVFLASLLSLIHSSALLNFMQFLVKTLVVTA